MDNKAATLVEHLAELRKRIIWVLAVLVLAMIGGFFVAGPLIQYLQQSGHAAHVSLHTFSPWDPIRVYMQFAFSVGLAVTIPFALFQAWLFVKPGLTPTEQRVTLRYIPGAVFLFFAGFAFGYRVVFPMAFYFATTVTRSLQLTETYGISQYFSFMFNIVIPMSLLFELPIVVMFLTRLRILNPSRLRKLRRYAYLLLVVLATLVTPPDMVSDILVAIPLILLYELSVILSGRVYRRLIERDRQREAEFGDA